MIGRMDIGEETLQDIINIETGLLYPLKGFMTEADFNSVVNDYTTKDGEVFTIPITLDISDELYNNSSQLREIELFYNDERVALIQTESFFDISDEDLEAVFGTLDLAHPGVAKEKSRSKHRVGGKTTLLKKELIEDALAPEKTKEIFDSKGWKTIMGFQTRNPIHKAHEYIQRLGLEICDGLFINPITGWKKVGDFSEEAVVSAYSLMIEDFYPKNRVYMAGLKTQMRYAGPREAIFHAIIRRNLGCTHFSIGRDHAGVGGFYGAYDAHELAKKIQKTHDLGIELILNREPYYCKKCKMVVTDRICGHYDSHRIEISGSIVRKYISEGTMPDEIMLRKEILEEILKCGHVFID